MPATLRYRHQGGVSAGNRITFNSIRYTGPIELSLLMFGTSPVDARPAVIVTDIKDMLLPVLVDVLHNEAIMMSYGLISSLTTKSLMDKPKAKLSIQKSLTDLQMEIYLSPHNSSPPSARILFYNQMQPPHK